MSTKQEMNSATFKVRILVACGDEILSLEICDGGDNVLICLHLKGMQIGLIEHQQG